MGTVIDFEATQLASLRRRMAEVEEANQDLIAFARGHSGATAAIHRAALAALEADGFEHLMHVVVNEWPDTLGLDAVAVALFADAPALPVDGVGLQIVDARVAERLLADVGAVVMRDVPRGHPLFGPASSLIRAEALVRLDAAPPLPPGMLALGQRRPQNFETRAGSELLLFLGRVLTRSMGRWLRP